MGDAKSTSWTRIYVYHFSYLLCLNKLLFEINSAIGLRIKLARVFQIKDFKYKIFNSLEIFIFVLSLYLNNIPSSIVY